MRERMRLKDNLKRDKKTQIPEMETTKIQREKNIEGDLDKKTSQRESMTNE